MKLNTNTTPTYVSPGLNLRRARWADAQAVADLTLAVCTADGDPVAAQTREDIERFWKTPDFNLETDAWVVTTDDGLVVGYEEFFNRHAHAHLDGDGYVHAEFRGRGIGTAMFRKLEARARRELALAALDVRAHLRVMTSAADTAGRGLLEHEGCQPIRFSWRMQIELQAPPPEPRWPAGVELRPFDKASHDRLVWQADAQAFSDHFGYTPGTFENWQLRVSGRDKDGTLWFVAWDGDQVAGYSLCRYRGGIGFVGALGVVGPWRRRGLGMALLQRSFGEFYRRGMPTIGLGVDSQNSTGATRLYERAGMHIASEFVLYEKELRLGRNLADGH